MGRSCKTGRAYGRKFLKGADGRNDSGPRVPEPERNRWCRFSEAITRHVHFLVRIFNGSSRNKQLGTDGDAYGIPLARERTIRFGLAGPQVSLQFSQPGFLAG